MKITILSSMPPDKGISKYTAAMLSGIPSNQSVEVVSFKSIYPNFLYPGGTKDSSLRLVDMHNISNRPILTWYNPISWIRAGLNIEGDILHIQWWTYVLAPVLLTVAFVAKFIKKKPIVVTMHNITPHEGKIIEKLANRLIYRIADHCIVHADSNKKALAEAYGSESNKPVSIVPHGVLMPSTPLSGVDISKAKKRLGIDTKNKVVLFFGIIRDYKGLDDLLKAFSLVRSRYTGVKLIIAGKPWGDWSKYQEIIDNNGMGNDVIKRLEFIPENEIETYYMSADLIVLPYKHFDSQSGVASLALPFGKPLLVSRVGGLTDLVKDYDLATFPSGDIKSMAQKITRILGSDKTRNRMGKHSIELSKDLDWNNIWQMNQRVYDSVLSR